MQFFGLLGSFFFFIGLLFILYLIVAKIVEPEFGLTNKPLFYIALTVMVIGSQFFLAGFLGELVTRNSPDRNSYLIEETAGLDA
jgi:hypothetical protein